jgi:phosphate transport system permease protein
MDKLSPQQLREYLGLTEKEYASMDHDTLKSLMELKVDSVQSVSADPDSALNTLQWRYLLLPHQWNGYEKPAYIWQPVSDIPKFNIVPLVIGSLKATIVALLVAVPMALGAAIYVSQLARPRIREIAKPVIELLAGIPSVVLGFFALIVMASVMQKIFGYESRLNAFVAGVALAFSVIPVVFSIAEDAMTSVPRTYVQAALALGASKWIVLMASGNASVVSWNVLDSTRTITATIAAEMGEVVQGSGHYRMLFLIGVLLFAVTFLMNLLADVVMHRLKFRMEGKLS